MEKFEPLSEEEITFYTLSYGENLYPDWKTYKRALLGLITSGKFMVLYSATQYPGVKRLWFGPKGFLELSHYGVIQDDGKILRGDWITLQNDDPLLSWIEEFAKPVVIPTRDLLQK